MELLTKHFYLYIDKSVLVAVVYLAFASRGGLNSGGLFSLLSVDKSKDKENC